MTHAAERPRIRAAIALVFVAALAVAAWIVVPAQSAHADSTYSVSGQVTLGTADVTAGAGEVIVYLRAFGPGTSGLSAATDSSGNFTIAGASPAATYSLYFRYSGAGDFSSEWLGNDPTIAQFTPAEFSIVASDVSGEDITLPTYQTMHGTVNDHTSPVTPAPGGSVTVSWTRSTEIQPDLDIDPDGSVPVAADGTFSVSLPAGYYFMYYQSNSPNWASTDDSSQRVLISSSPVTVPSVTLQGLDVVSGHVSLGDDSNPAGAGEVIVYSSDCSSSCLGPELATTDSNGDFSFSQAEGPTTLHLAFVYQGTEYQSADISLAIPDYNSHTYPDENVTLLPSASISGTVDLGDSGPAPAGTVTVEAMPTTSTPVVYQNSLTATVDANGDYTIPGLTSGPYILDFTYSGPGGYASAYWTTGALDGGPLAATGDDADPITVGTTDVPGRDITLPLGAYLSGTVTTSSGAPFVGSDAIDVVRHVDGLADENIDTQSVYFPDGTYTVGPLLPGEYAVQFSGDSDDYQFWNEDGANFAFPWAGSTAAEPWNADVYELAPGDDYTSANAVQYLNSNLWMTVSCTNCTESESVYLQLEVYDPVSRTWFNINPTDEPIEDGFDFDGLYPGTYRGVIERASDGAVVGTGDSFQITEGENALQGFDFTYMNPRPRVFNDIPLRLSVDPLGPTAGPATNSSDARTFVFSPIVLTTERDLRVVGR